MKKGVTCSDGVDLTRLGSDGVSVRRRRYGSAKLIILSFTQTDDVNRSGRKAAANGRQAKSVT